MAKFVIECPNCGKYAEANTGFFARKKIDCTCGYTINIKTDKLTTRTCPHCGNDVVFDQAKGADAKCPVCGEPINTVAEQSNNVEFSCQQCGIRLTTAKGAATYTCPVCDHVNDVAERVMNEKIRHDGLASIIKYEGDNNTLVWKHPIEDFNMGSQLIVHESQEAIFFRDGQALDLFGAGRYTLETQQLPILEKFYKLPTDTEGTFHSEVYYINMTTQMGIKWGTDSKVRLFDPASGMHLELGASGDFNIRVTNSRKLLLKLVGTAGGLKQAEILGDNGKGFFRTMVMTHVKSYLASTIRENAINILEIDERLMELSEALLNKINPKLAEYGLEMTEFFVGRVVTPDDDPNFRRMKEQYGERHLLQQEDQLRQIKAQSDVNVKLIGVQGDAEALKIQKMAEAEAYRMQAAVEAEEMRMKGYTYQQETARAVGMEAMKNGITGGAGGGLGELAGLGVSLGAMGSVMNMTKDALNPMMDSSSQMGQNLGGAVAGGWNCACGQQNIASNFCPNCGTKKPEPQTGWNCACGQQNITSNFCPNCGSKKPEAPKSWDCECGQQNITTNFCPNCGTKKPEEPKGWDCECGQKGIMTGFCPNCGTKKPE
ncbi:MAG: SPFH domain-containing protein [Oscillospiraceae bacterium]|nr:SPFH domain-containing protein [Oscillospiraceae bacterium]